MIDLSRVNQSDIKAGSCTDRAVIEPLDASDYLDRSSERAR